MTSVLSAWEQVPFSSAVQLAPVIKQVDAKDMSPSAAIPVITQGATYCEGFTDDREALLRFDEAIVFGDHTRAVKFVSGEFAVGPNVKVLVPRPSLLGRFLYYYLLAFRPPSRGYGRHFALLRKLTLVVPPLGEQGRIVAAIEEHFSTVERGGRLLGQVLSRSRGLQARALEALMDNGAGRWPEVSLSDVSEAQRNGYFWSRPGTVPTPVAIIRVSAVRPMRFFPEDVRYLPAAIAAAEVNPFILTEGDLLFTRLNGNPDYVGACAVARNLRGTTLFSDKFIRVKLRHERALPEYVSLAFGRGQPRRQMRSRVKTTAGQSSVAGSDVKTIVFPLPSIREQETIVQEALGVVDAMRLLGDVVASSERLAAALRASILCAAFTGELVAQDPPDQSAAIGLEIMAAGPKSRDQAARSTIAPRSAP